jgi:DNA integrity scanning protein DisA with diadenylate cyclase activity
MRGFVLGLFLFIGLAVTVLSLRPGGLRLQLRYAARRLRIVLVLGGVYVVSSSVVRIVMPNNPIAEYAPAALALVLLIVFLFVARDPSRSARPER